MSDPQPAPDFERLKAAAADMIAELRARGAVPGLEIGDRAPDFALPDQNGQIVTLRERLDRGPVVVSFYRGAWCPYCNIELRALQAALPRLEELGASLIAISPQRPDDALTLAEREQLAFAVLSDPDQEAIRAYRLRFELSDELKAIYPLLGMDLTELTADGSWHLPVPATFVLDPAGVVRARHVDPDYTRRMDVDEILKALSSLRPAG
jgi:peroxiredoxin